MKIRMHELQIGDKFISLHTHYWVVDIDDTHIIVRTNESNTYRFGKRSMQFVDKVMPAMKAIVSETIEPSVGGGKLKSLPFFGRTHKLPKIFSR